MKTLTLLQLGKAVVAAVLFWFVALIAIASVDLVLGLLHWKHLAPDMRVQAQIWMVVAVPIALISFFHQRRSAGQD